ncbi:hypothetical protein OIU76_005642 [Salix suchowensis]|nr:hypothetical protein OIU76_005642 [Salix suchowensis]
MPKKYINKRAEHSKPWLKHKQNDLLFWEGMKTLEASVCPKQGASLSTIHACICCMLHKLNNLDAAQCPDP